MGGAPPHHSTMADQNTHTYTHTHTHTHTHTCIYTHIHSIHGKLPTLSAELMERLRQALLLFMPRVNMKGPVPFLAKPVPTRCVMLWCNALTGPIHRFQLNFRTSHFPKHHSEAAFAFTIWCVHTYVIHPSHHGSRIPSNPPPNHDAHPIQYIHSNTKHKVRDAQGRGFLPRGGQRCHDGRRPPPRAPDPPGTYTCIDICMYVHQSTR